MYVHGSNKNVEYKTPDHSFYKGIVIDNFEIDEESRQEWLGENEYGNIYYYPVLPKLNKFGMLDEGLGTQTGLYDPFEFEINLENVIFQTEGESFYQGTLDVEDDVTLPKVPFGSPGRNWNDDDVSSAITNNFYQNPLQCINLNFDEIDEQKIEDISGNGNYGKIIHDYLIQYDFFTREASSDGLPEKESVESKNKNKAF